MRRDVLMVLFFGSCVVGGIAVAAQPSTAAARPAVCAVIVLVAPFGIVVAAAYDVLCGTT